RRRCIRRALLARNARFQLGELVLTDRAPLALERVAIEHWFALPLALRRFERRLAVALPVGFVGLDEQIRVEREVLTLASALFGLLLGRRLRRPEPRALRAQCPVRVPRPPNADRKATLEHAFRRLAAGAVPERPAPAAHLVRIAPPLV